LDWPALPAIPEIDETDTIRPFWRISSRSSRRSSIRSWEERLMSSNTDQRSSSMF
jgi:hypothetical protein